MKRLFYLSGTLFFLSFTLWFKRPGASLSLPCPYSAIFLQSGIQPSRGDLR